MNVQLRLLLPLTLASLLALSLAGCGDDESSSEDDTMDMAGDGALDGRQDVPPDGREDLMDDGGDVSGEDTPADQVNQDTGDASMDIDEDVSTCVTDRVTLAVGGTTSSCSFPVPEEFDTGAVNVFANGRQLCRRSSRNCNGLQGWFWINGEVGLCDETCIAWSAGPLVVEHGCTTENCTSGCLQPGEFCGNDGLCCIRSECELGSCRSCSPAGESCNNSSDCCDLSTCVDGTCMGGFDAHCTDDVGCTQGECANYLCRCPNGFRRCGGECAPDDESNCGSCGNVCDADEICRLNQCQCDPNGPLPDECGDACVNTDTDLQHCGFCNRQCLTGNKTCIAGACVCPEGTTECSGNCVDTSTSQSHCGGCNSLCNPGSEVCSGGSCVCAPDYTDCSGICRNLNTDTLHCGMCGNSCNGQRVCQNGVCVMP